MSYEFYYLIDYKNKTSIRRLKKEVESFFDITLTWKSLRLNGAVNHVTSYGDYLITVKHKNICFLPYGDTTPSYAWVQRLFHHWGDPSAISMIISNIPYNDKKEIIDDLNRLHYFRVLEFGDNSIDFTTGKNCQSVEYSSDYQSSSFGKKSIVVYYNSSGSIDLSLTIRAVCDVVAQQSHQPVSFLSRLQPHRVDD
jgi:hypothetical protein